MIQNNSKCRSASRCVSQQDLSVVKLYDFLGDAQAESEVCLIASGSIEAVESFKDGILLVIRDTGAVVDD